VPPATKSNLVLFLKVNACFFHASGLVLFGLALLAGALLEFPYGGFNMADFQVGSHKSILIVTGVLVAARAAVILFRQDFSKVVELALLLEGLAALFVVLWWSWGLPLLATLLLSAVANLCVFQLYWAIRLRQTVTDIRPDMPQRPDLLKLRRTGSDSISFRALPGLDDLKRLLGFKRPDLPCEIPTGIFAMRTLQNISHAEALEKAYMQALFTREQHLVDSQGRTLWPHNPDALGAVDDLFSITLSLLPGLCHALAWYACAVLAGLWLGEVSKRLDRSPDLATCLTFTLLLCALAAAFAHQTRRLVSRAVGVAVAEKEWLANDVVLATEIQETLWMQSIDAHGTPGESPHDHGRLNIASGWLCSADLARRTGATYLARICFNLSAESTCMVTGMRQFEYIRPLAAFWDTAIDGIILQASQTLFLVALTTVYFGSYVFSARTPPVSPLAAVAILCTVSMLWKAADVRLIATSLRLGGDNEHRRPIVLESVFLTVVLFVLSAIGLLAFLLPLVLEEEPYVWACGAQFLAALLPGTCAKAALA